MRALILALAVLATPAHADYPETVQAHILPGYAAFEAATATLADKAQQTCETSGLVPAFHLAFDAWMGVQHLVLGQWKPMAGRWPFTIGPTPKRQGPRRKERFCKAIRPS